MGTGAAAVKTRGIFLLGSLGSGGGGGANLKLWALEEEVETSWLLKTMQLISVGVKDQRSLLLAKGSRSASSRVSLLPFHRLMAMILFLQVLEMIFLDNV